jgi:hypothetical protein
MAFCSHKKFDEKNTKNKVDLKWVETVSYQVHLTIHN